MDGDEGLTDAALPPTVRTSRPPSGMSNYTATRSPSYIGTSSSQPVRTPPMRSRRSSYGSMTKEKASYSKNKLSAESWVKHNSLSHESFESTSTKRTPSLRSLRRMPSHDSLRRVSTRIDILAEADDAAESPVVSRAEQIIAKATTPPLSSAKRRLYLTDSGSTEEHSIASTPIKENPEGEDEATSPAATIDEEKSRPRMSPRKASIVDSIPMRTSSLRQSSSPIPGKKKERKSKRSNEKLDKTNRKGKSDRAEHSTTGEALTEGKVDSVMSKKAVQESSWADLGEEDGTVKRIRELQEQRKSRLLESHAIVYPKVANAKTAQTPVPSKIEAARRSEENNRRAARARPDTLRSVTEPPVKAHEILGIVDNGAPPPSRGQEVNSKPTVNGIGRRRNLSLDEKQLQARPTTSTAPTPPLSLDYSYADAVDALQGAEREPKKEHKERPSHRRKSSARTTEQLPNIAAQFPGTVVNFVPAVTPSADTTPLRLTKSQRRKQQDRWTHYHPDLPLEFEKKKNRRKSTSDARNTQYLDLDTQPPVPRGDSIEMAVTDYLQDARMSQHIKHAVTGRVISYSEVGDRNGAAVFICVGMGLTRYVTAFYDELATTLRLRLITVDRPGVGGSEAYPPTDRSGPLNWPDDVWTICQSLGITKFSMLAHSAGAIYALATALVMPHLIHGKIHLLAPWIPPSQLGAVPHSTASAPPAGALPRSQRFLRVLPTPFLKAANSSFMTATSASLKPAAKRTKSHGLTGNNTTTSPIRGKERPATRDGAPAPTSSDFNRRESMMLMDQFMPDVNQMENYPIPVDAEEGASLARNTSVVMSATATPMDPSFEFASSALNAAEHTEKERKMAYTTHLTQRTWELAVRDSNPATDLLVCLERHRDVGFRYTDVSRAVVMTHGSEDKRVPLANIKWLAEQMNRRAEASVPQSRDGLSDPSAWGGCELRILAGEGHGLMASPSIMGDCLTEIAKYWKTR